MNHSRNRGNQYVNPNGRKREELDKRKPTTTVGSGSGLPTPEPEMKKLPDIETPGDNSPEINPAPTTRAGKAPERTQIPDITPTQAPLPNITPTDDMDSIGAILCGMKLNVVKLETALNGMMKQAEALTALHGPLKLQEELQTVQRALRQQIQRQNEDIKKKREELEALLIRELDARIKKNIDDKIHIIVEQAVAVRIQMELNKLIPDELKTQSNEHYGRMQDIKSRLKNSEARRKNANAEGTARLHPLVISRAAAISRTSSGSSAYTAGGILPTPLDTDSLLFPSIRKHREEFDISPVFPHNPQQLFEWYYKDRPKINRLYEDYEGAAPIDLQNDHQVAGAIDKLFHNFGVLRPGRHVMLSPVVVKDGRRPPLSPLIITEGFL